MSPGVVSAASNLSCADSSLFEDVESEVVDSVLIGSEFNANPGFISRDYYRILSSGFFLLSPLQREECLCDLFKREIQHLPCGDYLNRLRIKEVDFKARKQIIDWITEVHRYYNFGPVTAYLSINYLDRFLSAHELPVKAWMMQLLGVACLSLAAKMEETQVPLSLDLQIGEPRFEFGDKTVQRMELLVLSKLHWRTQSVTPFNYLDYFLCRICDNQMPPRCLFSKAIQLITTTTKGIEYLEYRPSEIAAAVTISVAVETHTVLDMYKALSLLSGQVKKEVVTKCVKMIQESSLMAAVASADEINGGDSIGFLDDSTYLSCRINDDSESSANSKLNCSTLNPKRRKLMFETQL